MSVVQRPDGGAEAISDDRNDDAAADANAAKGHATGHGREAPAGVRKFIKADDGASVPLSVDEEQASASASLTSSSSSSSSSSFAAAASAAILSTMPSQLELPSLRTLSKLALGAAQAVLGASSSAQATGTPDSCPNPTLSCSSSASSNTCCVNSPGGVLLQTQFWDTDPATGPDDSWTIHGLWPDNCDGTYNSNCDSSRAYTNITSILKSFGDDSLVSYMDTYWVSDSGTDESFWEHEWGKHGTCVSTLDPDCYTDYTPTQEVPDFFNAVVDLFKTLPTYTWLSDAGITPSNDDTYSAADIQAALKKHHGYDVYLGCDDGTLDEVWYFFNVKGSIQTGTFEPTALVGSSSTCPSDGISYPPKN
ncbi:MAG: hypothetical protein M1819_006077 [Sarea resinae]|nr:MAG: hypothetical protein M1819_006077 [Sarea resinae]